MDSIKSPRFWLALAGLVAVSALAACKVLSSDVAAGLLLGLLSGIGVSTPPTKSGAIAGGTTAAVALFGLGGALLSGCAVGPDAVMASLAAAGALVAFLAIRSMVLQHKMYLETRRARRADVIRKRLDPDRVVRLHSRFARRKAELLPALVLLPLLAGGCATTGGETIKDKIDICRAGELAIASHQVAASTAALVCQALKDPAKRAKCLEQTNKYRTIGDLLVTLGYSALSACGLK